MRFKDGQSSNKIGQPTAAPSGAPSGASSTQPAKNTSAVAVNKPTPTNAGVVQGGNVKTAPRSAPVNVGAKPTSAAPTKRPLGPTASTQPQSQPKPVNQPAAEEQITYSTFEENHAAAPPISVEAARQQVPPHSNATPSSSHTTTVAAAAVNDEDAVYSEFADSSPAVVSSVAINPSSTVTQSVDDEPVYSEFDEAPSAAIPANATAAATLANVAPSSNQASAIVDEDPVYSEFDSTPTPVVQQANTAAAASTPSSAALPSSSSTLKTSQPSYVGHEDKVEQDAVYTEFADPSAATAIITNTSNGYVDESDLTEDASATHSHAVGVTSSTAYANDASGYLDEADAMDLTDTGYATGGAYLDDETGSLGSGDTDDAYGVLDLSEATLNSDAYLVESDVTAEPEPAAPEPASSTTAAAAAPEAIKGFGSAYHDLEIDDPAVAFVLKEGSELDVDGADLDDANSQENDLGPPESKESAHIRDSLDLLRRSSSSSSLPRLRRTGSLRLPGAQDEETSLTSSNASVVSSATSSGYASFDSEAQRIAHGSASTSNTVSPRTGAGTSSRAAPLPLQGLNGPNSSTNEYYSLNNSASSASGYGANNAGVPSSSGAAPPASVSSYTSNPLNASGGKRSLNASGSSSGSERKGGNRNLPHPSKLVNAQIIQEVLDAKESWNDRFQAIFDAPESESKYDALHRLSVDFLGVAETYGKVIISELSLPDSEKSIPPINIGGVAGGSKYAVRGLLFKFAVDVPPHFLYGSDEYAQKAAGHELKGLNQWALNSEGLHFPLMALVRYCGFTLVALSMLPIGGSPNGKNSLVYGSDDAGRSVHFDDDVIYEKMKKTALALNLKGHYLVADTSRLMYGPGDIEGHLGNDGLHYALDYARVYPPAALVQGEIREKSRCLFRLLRPELVSRFSKPLSSDAFTAWGRMNSDIHNAEVREATQYLVDQAIPALAKALPHGSAPQWYHLRRDFHLHGVNIRYMGLVRRVTLSSGQDSGSDDAPSLWLLREMVVRVLKSTLNQKWRELIKKYQRITPDRCIQEAIGVINAAIEPQTTTASKQFWGKTIRDLLSVKFPLALTDEELVVEVDEHGILKSEPNVNLQKLVFASSSSWAFFFNRLSELTGMVFNSSLLNAGSWPSFGVLTTGDVLEIRSSVKQMSLVDFAFVMAKSLNGLRQMSPALATRLFSLAIQRLRESPQISLVILRRVISLKAYIIRTLKRMKWAESLITAVAEFVDVALDGAQLMCNKVPTDLAVDAAMFLHEIHATNKASADSKIIGYLQRAIDTDEKNVRPYLEIAKIRVFSGRPFLTDEARIWIDRVYEIGAMDPLIRLQLGLLLLSAPASTRYSTAVNKLRDVWIAQRYKSDQERKAILNAREKMEAIVAAEKAAAEEKATKASEGEGEKAEEGETSDATTMPAEERSKLEEIAARELPAEENATFTPPAPEEIGCPILEEVLQMWLPIKEQQPHLFGELDYHIFLPRADTLEVIEPWNYPVSSTTRAGSFLCLAYVASRLQCPELDDAIRDLMQAGAANDPTLLNNPLVNNKGPASNANDIVAGAEFTSLLLILSLTFAFDSQLVNYLTSLGPYNTVTRLIIHGKAESTRFTATEAEFGRFLKAFPRLVSLHLPDDLPNITGSCFADLVNPQQLVALDLVGTKCTGEDLEALIEMMTKGLSKPATHNEIIVQATAIDSENPETSTTDGPIVSVFTAQTPFITMLLPSTVAIDSITRTLNMLSGLANLEHLTVGHISDEFISSVGLFGASLQFLSLAGIAEVDATVADKVLSLLPNLLLLDCAKTGLAEARCTSLLTRPRLHPTLECIIVSNEIMHFFSGNRTRTAYISSVTVAGKTSIALDIPAEEWPCLSLKKFCMPHVSSAVQHTRFNGGVFKSQVLTLLQVEKTTSHGPTPILMRARGRESDSMAYTCKSSPHLNALQWVATTIVVAETKAPTTFGMPPAVGFLYNGRLDTKNTLVSGGNGLRVKIDLPGLSSQYAQITPFGRASFTYPPGMHLNYAGMAYITLIKQQQ